MTSVDTIKEAADAKAWEELNRGDPHAKAAVELLTQAVQTLQTASELLSQAAAEVWHSPETHRIAALQCAADSLTIDVQMQARRLE